MMGRDEFEELEEGVLEVSPKRRFIKYNEVVCISGLGIVYKGFDQDHGVEVACNQMMLPLKSSSSSESILSTLKETLLSTASMVKSLRHLNVMRCYSSWIDEANNTFNMVTELFNSGSLRQFRKKHKYVDMKAIKNWSEQILKGLHYLHSHNPPIIHRNLSCDTVFVNGNHGDVKIGDLGLSFSNDKDDKLIDIRSFGMCLLELISSEECSHQDSVDTKSPLALSKVKDSQAREIIEKCVAAQHLHHHLSAEDLLNEPFFSSSSSSAAAADGAKRPRQQQMVTATEILDQGLEELASSGSSNVVDSSENSVESSQGSSTTTTTEELQTAPALELWRFKDVMQLRLRGSRIDGNSVGFNLGIIHLKQKEAFDFSFEFDLHKDDALSIVVELVKGKDLSYRYLPEAVDLIDTMLLQIVPDWNPTY